MTIKEHLLDYWVKAEIKDKYIILANNLEPHIRKFIDTEEATRNALIKMGWTPPPKKSCIEKDCDDGDCRVCYPDQE